MSEADEGLSILENSAIGTFTVTLRGYDRQEVDRYAARMESSLAECERRLARLDDEATRLRKRLRDLTAPNFGSLGHHARELLRLAEQEAGRLRTTAERQGEEIRAQARHDAIGTRTAAEREAAEIRRRAHEDAERRREATDEESERILASARGRYDQLRTEAGEMVARERRKLEQELAQRRRTVEHELATLRAAAEREVSEWRAAAERETAERRAAAVTLQDKTHREAAATHAAAVAEAQRTVAAAEQQRAAMERRVVELDRQTEERLRNANERVHEVLAKARRDADRIRAEARTTGEGLVAEAESAARLRADRSTQEIANLTKQREEVLLSLAHLRDTVAAIATQQSGETVPAGTRPAPSPGPGTGLGTGPGSAAATGSPASSGEERRSDQDTGLLPAADDAEPTVALDRSALSAVAGPEVEPDRTADETVDVPTRALPRQEHRNHDRPDGAHRDESHRDGNHQEASHRDGGPDGQEGEPGDGEPDREPAPQVAADRPAEWAGERTGHRQDQTA